MNAMTPGCPTETDTSALFQRFPHLRKIELLWGSRECRNFIFALMTDTRGGGRQGFPPEHAMTIMKLLMEHDFNYPQFEHGGHDGRWGDDDRR